MPTRVLTADEVRALQEVELAEDDCLRARIRLEEARERFTTILRKDQHQRERPKHLRLVRSGEDHRQSA
jgi:hypothetical protein